MFIVLMSKMLRPFIFLDGDQFKEPFNHWIIKHQPALNFVLINADNRTDDYTPWPSRRLKPCR